METVVIAVDGSKHSEHAVRYARGLLAPFGKVKLYLVHVVPLYHVFVDGILETDLSMQVQLREAYEERGRHILEKVSQLLEDSPFEVESLLCDGDIVSEIIRISQEVKADLLVVGSRGLGEVKSMFLGSVSHKVVHHARCPVLLVKDDEAETVGSGNE